MMTEPFSSTRRAILEKFWLASVIEIRFFVLIITDLMPKLNHKDYDFIVNLMGKENIHEIPYILDYYELRDRCKAVIQTGDYGIHAQAILIAGYPSDDIPMDWLKNGLKKHSSNK